jgi:hypothetical protein
LIPLVVYMLVAVGGFFTCGDQCNEIIINRDIRPADNDYLMDASKVSLLVCLVVGIIIRNQSNKAGIFGIIDQFKKIGTDELVQKTMLCESNAKISVSPSDGGIGDSASGQLSEQLRNASSAILTEQIDNTPFWVIVIVQFFNSLVPAVTAILVKDDLINYVESGSGFLAPVFMIIYPCN